MYSNDDNVIFKKENGPVVISIVRTGKAIGRYKLSLYDGTTWTDLGGGDIDDRVPDIFAIPCQGDELNTKTLLIVANYLPKDRQTDSVIYRFAQKDIVLAETKIPWQNDGVNTCYSTYTFELT